MTALTKRIKNFPKANAPVANALHQLETATREGNVLDAKMHELIFLVVAATTKKAGDGICLSGTLVQVMEGKRGDTASSFGFEGCHQEER
ncbi:hypothetical protein GCM10027202_26220 [Microvirgula curvata]